MKQTNKQQTASLLLKDKVVIKKKKNQRQNLKEINVPGTEPPPRVNARGPALLGEDARFPVSLKELWGRRGLWGPVRGRRCVCWAATEPCSSDRYLPVLVLWRKPSHEGGRRAGSPVPVSHRRVISTPWPLRVEGAEKRFEQIMALAHSVWCVWFS